MAIPSLPSGGGEAARDRRAVQAKVANLSTLKRGSHGADVVKLQKELKAAGCDPGPVDGKFGPRTERAVTQYQQRNKLGVDGIAGNQTWKTLMTDRFDPATPAKGAPKPSWPSPVCLPPPAHGTVAGETAAVAAEIGNPLAPGKGIVDMKAGYAQAAADSAEVTKYRQEAEQQLKALPPGADAKPILDGLAEKDAQFAAKYAGKSESFKLGWWTGMVNTGKAWDLKGADSSWRNDTLTYGGQPLRSDDMGNIHYGYVGSALFNDGVLKYGAGMAQGVSNLMHATESGNPLKMAQEVKRFIGSLAGGGFGDNAGDAAAIQRGIDARRALV